ncbi:hypothetical protein [Blastococcus sp. SYSU D00820]
MVARSADVEWLLEPLVTAGLDAEEIQTLVCRLGFEVLTADGAPGLLRLHRVAADRAPRVQAAWMETVGRLLG